MAPPSNLPSWTGFNTLVLEGLCERLAEFSRGRQPTADILRTLHARRDATRFLSPDFQAQLMEEEVGRDYFRVWQSLQAAPPGPVHEAVAELAARGALAAIVTTNFDRLLEAALAARNVPFHVAHDAPAFAALARGAVDGSPLSVIKIHGSLEDPESMVDTLRQRIAGRPAALQSVLDELLRSRRWLYLGFSGADFTHVPNYLNVLGSAADAKGFVFVSRPGTPVPPGVERVLVAYGPGKAKVVEGELPGWLIESFGLSASAGAAAPCDTTAAVRDGVRAWATALGPMSVVNIIVAMLRSCGLDRDALFLMRKTWRSYRAPEDARGPSYDRYNFNYGQALLDVGFLRNPVARADDLSNLMEWKAGADQNGFEYLARGYSGSHRPAFGAALARLLALRGEVGRAVDLCRRVTKDASTCGDGLELCDVAIECAGVYDMLQAWTAPLVQLRAAHAIACELGDEPRRARLAIVVGRFLTYAGRPEEAATWLDEGEALSARYDLQFARCEALAARGLWLLESGRVTDALAMLEILSDDLRARDSEPLYTRLDVLAGDDTAPEAVLGITPLRVRVALDLAMAAERAGNGARLGRVFDELDELTVEHFPGYCPQYYHAYAAALIEHGADDQSATIADLLDRLELLSEEQGNPWGAQAAGDLRRHWSPPPPV
ncbi:SIR2 family protein [Methylolobus aquaticus]